MFALSKLENIDRNSHLQTGKAFASRNFNLSDIFNNNSLTIKTFPPL